MEPEKAKYAVAAGRALGDSGFRRKFLLRLLSSPLILGPFLAGVTLLLALWTFSLNVGIAIFAGIACMLGAAGWFFTRLLMGSESVGKKVIEEMQFEAHTARERELDELDRELTADGDQRTEKCLRDLRALAKAFFEKQEWALRLDARSSIDILTGVERLFDRCVFLLGRTLELWYTARDTVTEQAREPILRQREKIIEDVGKSIEQLGEILAGIQGFGIGEGVEYSDLKRIRNELDRSLAVARAVDERMRYMERELDRRTLEGDS